ncbi:hypothetical protein B296_00054052, partial [Ensete ventricosum]
MYRTIPNILIYDTLRYRIVLSLLVLYWTGTYRAYQAARFATYRSARLSVRGLPTTGQYRQKSTIDGRFRPSAADRGRNRPLTVDFGRRQSIEGEIDRRRSIEEEKGKKKKKKRKKKKRRRRYFPRAVLARAPLPPSPVGCLRGDNVSFSPACRCRHRPWVTHAP